MSRTVVWFSAGAASAVCAKLVSDEPREGGRYDELQVVYTDPGNEHPDNHRFLLDVRKWIDYPINVLRHERYVDAWDLWEKDGYLVGPMGARCSLVLKKRMRQKFEDPTDRQVFGYTSEERDRADQFRRNNPDVDLWCPLIDRGITKADCLAIIREAGVELPAMYALGYKNNNCIGCVKGGMGYWNKIREDFPAHFDRMARLERRLDVSLLHEEAGGERRRVFLDELKPGRGRYSAESEVECSLLCLSVLDSGVSMHDGHASAEAQASQQGPAPLQEPSFTEAV